MKKRNAEGSELSKADRRGGCGEKEGNERTEAEKRSANRIKQDGGRTSTKWKKTRE